MRIWLLDTNTIIHALNGVPRVRDRLNALLRRHDFTIDILGGATGLLYATDYRDVDGIRIPTKRRGYAWQGDYQLVPEPLLVAIA